MASSRDDFIIAIRSAFLKKSTQQKFSLLTLVFISIFTILLSSLDFKVIRYLKIGINELVYRSSFLVSIPEKFIKNTYFEIVDYSTFFNDYKGNKEELGKQYGIKCPYGIDKIRPRYKKDNTTKKIHETVTPKFKQLVNDSPELKQKLEDYLAPDVWYYAKAK